MKTLRTETIVPVFIDEGEFLPASPEMEPGKFYISEYLRGSKHLCLCGCRTPVYLPIRPGEWSITREANNTITVAPSILQRFDCKSHYIITKNKANFV